MLENLITSKTKIKLLLKFFLNINNKAYLTGLEQEFNQSTNSIRPELNRFEQAGLLVSFIEGNKKLYKANILHPLFKDLNSIIRKFIGIEEIFDSIIDRLGNVEKVYLEGQLAKGLESDVIDFVVVGDGIDKGYLGKLVEKVEPILNKKVRYRVFQKEDSLAYISKHENELVLIEHIA